MFGECHSSVGSMNGLGDCAAGRGGPKFTFWPQVQVWPRNLRVA